MAMNNDALDHVEGFEWDKGNIQKNWERHGVSHIECEEAFFNNPLVVKKDAPHSTNEERYFVLGRTDTGRLLFIVFTVRNNRVRVISARDMSKKERKLYEKTENNT
jgi:uncharacterized DUF497 family protein